MSRALTLLNYLFRRSASACVQTGGVLLALVLLVDFAEHLRQIAIFPEGTLFGAVQLTLLKSPTQLHEILPFAILIGSILAFARLNRSSELHVIRASGMSAWQFLFPGVLVAVLAGLAVPVLLNPVAAVASSEYQYVRAGMNGKTRYQHFHARNGIWLRQTGSQSSAIIRARSVSPQAALLREVDIFLFEGSSAGDMGRFERRIHAETAQLTEGLWQLRDVIEYRNNREAVHHDRLTLPTDLPPGILLHRNVRANFVSFWEYPQRLAELRQARLDETAYTYTWHALLATPVLYAAMALAALLVCLRLNRSGGMAFMIGLGIIGGILVFWGVSIARSFALVGTLPPEVAAWCPPLFALNLALMLIALTEDG